MIIACNTAHLLLPELEKITGHRFESLIETSVNHIARGKYKSIGILASPTTIGSKIYQLPLESIGAKVILPTQREQDIIERIIRLTIAGQEATALRKQLFCVAQDMRTRGAETVLLGCTELSVIAANAKELSIVDPLELIVETLIEHSD